MIHRRKDFKCRHKARFPLAMKDHDTGYIAAAVAVVGCAPYGHEILVKVVFVPLHDELMGSCDQREVVDMIELESARRKERQKERRKRKENIKPRKSKANIYIYIYTYTGKTIGRNRGGTDYLQSNLVTE